MNKSGLKYGLIAGVATIVYLLVFYFISKKAMVGPWVFYSTLVIYLAAMILAARERKSILKEQFSVREGLQAAFLTYVIANAFFYVFYYVIQQSDPSLAELQKEAMREYLPHVTPKNKLGRALKDLEDTDLTITPGGAVFGFARGTILGFLLALGVAFGVKRIERA
jgi:Ca2+/Na+ antiporter